ncbi:helix-turn-helix domain-containing protein [Brevundimonas goettingensis]|uniref:helix-turn-helix domain-containing protein n=1 Tax=Brevundimonas goettingensis TaxID=2774190 RepID=UPI001CEC578D
MAALDHPLWPGSRGRAAARAADGAGAGDGAAGDRAPDAGGGGEELAEAERGFVRRALARADGNVSAAARALGVRRATLHRRS